VSSGKDGGANCNKTILQAKPKVLYSLEDMKEVKRGKRPQIIKPREGKSTGIEGDHSTSREGERRGRNWVEN